MKFSVFLMSPLYHPSLVAPMLVIIVYCIVHDWYVLWPQVKFTTDCPAQGNRNYIPVSDLYGRNFTDANGEFQLELSIGHVRTLYDTEFRVPTSLTSRLMHHHHQIQNQHNPTAGNALQHQYGSASPRGTKCKLETSYFTFGGFDWNLALYPHGVKDVSCKYGQHYTDRLL